MSLLLVTTDNRILVTVSGEPAWLPFAAVPPERYLDTFMYTPLADSPEGFDPELPEGPSAPLLAIRATAEDEAHWETKPGLKWETIRFHLGAEHIAKVVAELRFRETYRFHPTTGAELFNTGSIAQDPSQNFVYPRINPAVIGLVELAGQGKILLARNRQRPAYFSLIAGYVGLGETLERAWEREVWEETGRKVSDIVYWGSQPWPSTSSLMVAFTGITHDEAPRREPDGELAEIRWVSREELAELRLPASGSIARTLIDWWVTQ